MEDDLDEKQKKKTYDPRASARKWERELNAAKKELAKWHATARRVNQKYLDERDNEASGDAEFKLNLFWSNVQVLKSSLYAKPPRVDVSNSFKDSEDDVSRVGGNILERMLNHAVERDNSDFKVSSQEGVGDYLVPGLGQIWYSYEVETGMQKTQPVMDPMDPSKEIVPPKEYEAITYEDCLSEYVYWEDFWWSPCRTWAECRWVAKRVYMNREDLIERFGEKIGKQVPITKQKHNRDPLQPQNDPWQKAGVFEIWDRTSKRVIWHVMGFHTVLDEKDDPLKLSQFFPCPPPLISNTTSSKFMPRPDYVLAQDQYNQIDELTTRITHLVRACKVVGGYDKTTPELGTILESRENKLVPVNNWGGFSEKGGLRGSMDLIDTTQIAKTIAELTAQRDILIAKLYEVLGIGDIMRGMTNPDETLGAQQLKAQFGGSRLQFKQMQIGEWVAAGQRIRAEVICHHFQPQTILERSNIMNSPDAPLAQQAIAFLKQDKTKYHRITVESETMALVDWAQERDSRVQFMQAVGGFVDAVTPLLQAAPAATPIVLQMMKWGLGGFRVGKEIESVLDQAIAQAGQQSGQQQPDPKAEAEVDETRASAFDKRAGGVKKLVEAQQTEIQAELMTGRIPSPEQQAAAAAGAGVAPQGGGPLAASPQGPKPSPSSAALNTNPMQAIQPGAGIPPTPIPGVRQP